MNEKLLKILIYISGVVCLYAFIAVRIPSMFNAILKEKIIPEYWENTKFGELYYFGLVKDFREKELPPYKEKYRFNKKHPTLQQADILMFGDSFFDFSRMTTFPERFGDTTRQRTFYARMDRPLEYLGQQQFSGSKEKIILYESAERYIPERFLTPHSLAEPPDPRSGVRKTVAHVRDLIFQDNTDVLYGTLVARNVFTTGLYSASTTLKFNLFKYITDQTPVYSLEEEMPWLFFHDQLNGEPSSFYYQHSQEEIDTYCDNIADLALKLNEYYNLKMVFMAIPSKYTIYHTLVNEDQYNNFLPRLYAGLEARGVPYIPLYDDFMQAKAEGWIYYGTDTHWTNKGLGIALDKTLKVLDTL
jgi:hypothetical protein